MSLSKNLLLIGDSVKVKEFQRLLKQSGAVATIAPNIDRALALAEADRPDGIVFILPVYWESVSPFVEKVRQNQALASVPIIYLGEFIEASDQIVLKRQGVHTMTLGPVPEAEIVRFILKVISS